MGKRRQHLVLHILIGCLCILHASSVRAGTPMRDDAVIVVMQSARTIEEANRVLPAGYAAASQFLHPDRSVYFTADATRRAALPAPSRRQRLLLRSEDVLTRTFLVTLPPSVRPTAAVQMLTTKHRHAVAWAEPAMMAEPQGVPNDPRIGQQAYLATVSALAAWDIYAGDTAIVVGISDNGVMQNHEDIGPNIAVNTAEIPGNGIDDDNNGVVDDYRGVNFAHAIDGAGADNTENRSGDGHGTKVAGLASAATNNGVGIAGIGNRSRLFPMKVSVQNSTSIMFGYQSLIYAAQRRFPVVNTSWGTVKPASRVDQAVIDYCVGMNTLVVASAGNHGTGPSGEGWREQNFPSAYDGVLGVGETTVADIVEFSSGLGVNADVMAPGNGAYTTDAAGGYTDFNMNGTSFASPMVAGLAALVRGRYPALDAEQVAAHIRRTADDISGKNPSYGVMLPGRMNMERALRTDPMASPALRIVGVRRTFRDGTPADVFAPGDTIHVSFELINDLGAATDVGARLTVADANGWVVNILEDANDVGAMATGQERRTREFVVEVVSISDLGSMIFGLEVIDATYSETLLWYCAPPTVMGTFENTQVVYSVGADGTLGYSSTLTTRQGAGYGWKPTGYQLMSPGGFLLSESRSRSLTAYKQDVPYISDFTATRYFGSRGESNAVMTDTIRLAQPIGVEVRQRCSFLSPTEPVAVINVNVTNVTDASLSQVSSGYFMDWDIGTRGDENVVRAAPNAIPPGLTGPNVSAFTVTRNAYPVAICCAVLGHHASDSAQIATMLLSSIVDDADGFTEQDRIRLLNSGTTITESRSGDICAVAGMKHTDILPSGTSYGYSVVMGVGADAAEAEAAVRRALGDPTHVHESEQASIFTVHPLPASEKVTMDSELPMLSIEIMDLAGRSMRRWDLDGARRADLSVADLPSGLCVVRCTTATSVIHRIIMIAR